MIGVRNYYAQRQHLGWGCLLNGGWKSPRLRRRRPRQYVQGRRTRKRPVFKPARCPAGGGV